MIRNVLGPTPARLDAAPAIRAEIVAPVDQGFFGVTSPESPRRVLATLGIASCVAVVGYCEDKKIGFLAHVDTPSSFDKGLGGLLWELRRALGEATGTFSIRLLSNEIGSARTMDELERLLQGASSAKIKFSMDERNSSFGLSSFAMDTGDGTIAAIDSSHPGFDSVRGRDSMLLMAATFERVFGDKMKCGYSFWDNKRIDPSAKGAGSS